MMLSKHFKSICADQILREHPNKDSYKKFCKKLEALQWHMTQMRLQSMDTGIPDELICLNRSFERSSRNRRSLGRVTADSDDDDSDH